MVSELLVVVGPGCTYVSLVRSSYVATLELVFFLGFCEVEGNVTLRNLSKSWFVLYVRSRTTSCT